MPNSTAITENALAHAKAKLADGTLTPADLDQLHQSARANAAGGQLRQRLLYLHAAHPNVRSPLVNVTPEEPIAGYVAQIDPVAPQSPYNCVQDTLAEGWRIIHFPDQRAPFDDREIDILGYEFILEKMEVIDG